VNRELAAAFGEYGALSRRTHPGLIRILERCCASGEVVALLPGVFVPRVAAGSWQVRARAALLWDPDAILLGDAAAAVTYWPELVPTVVAVAARRTVISRPGFAFSRRVIPPELVGHRAGLRFTVPELTAIDLVPTRGGDAIDRALRSRMATLPGMYDALALTPWRPGNQDRRLMLLDSRDEPWSGAERLAHRIFREAGITDWRANAPFQFDGRNYFLDMEFRRKPLVIEIDGRVHLEPAVFESDRVRGNDLVLGGRWVLHFTWLMLDRSPRGVIETTIRALEQL
jgi:very-short-patch-repair endonuclease